MAYRIEGLDASRFAHLIGADEAALVTAGAVRVRAERDRGWPCRITLEDAAAGETLILVNHVSHDVATPFRASHAIYLRELAAKAGCYFDAVPPVFEGRILSLRAFDREGMLADAALAMPGDADAKIRELLDQPDTCYIHAHNAVPGCFSACIRRY